MSQSFSSNVLANGVLQVLNYAFPLVALPFLTWVLSPETFGALNYFSFLVGYFSLFVVFGLEYSATREVVRKVHAGEDLTKFYSQVMSAKVHLLFAATLVYFAVLLVVPDVENFWSIALSTYTITLGFAFSPVWLFMGLKRMGAIILPHSVPKIVLLALVFYLVKTDADAFYYPLALGLSTLMGHGASWALVKKKVGISFKWKSWQTSKAVISEGRFAFGVTVLAVMLQTGGVLVLERFSDFATVGGFSLGWRLMNLIQVLVMVPVYQALFPMVGEHLAAHTWTVRQTLKMVLPRVFGLLSVMLVAGYLCLPWVLNAFFGSQYAWSFEVFASLIPFVFVNALNQLIGVQILLHLGHDRTVFYLYLLGVLTMVGTSWLLIPAIGWLGTSLALFAAEVLLAVCFWRVLQKANLYN